MLSQRKHLLRAAEKLAFAVSAGALAIAVAAGTGRAAPQDLAPFLIPTLACALAVFAVSVALFHELARQLHGAPGPLQEVELSPVEMRLLLRWCPGVFKLAFAAASAVLAYVLVSIGAVDWSFGQPLGRREAVGTPLFAAAFSLVAIPVLASAARMPGAFADHFPAAPPAATAHDTRTGPGT